MELNYVITITDRSKRDEMAALYSNNGLHMTLTHLGKGTATTEHLSIYGLEATDKAIIGAVAGPDSTKQLIKAAKRKMFMDNKAPGGAAPEMTFSHELIIVILNEGYSDRVMDAARAAGAAGGTVLHAKGTGAVRAEKFFGVSLADEKDVIYIVARSSEKADIMRSINENAGTGTRAGAICFSLPISSVVGLRAFEDD